eukprot:TRINITY_DN336_c0_g1_i4.p2 TRINITY_DN336_c0_g1~~TRINITY_DN336_c0_g1_i4.p2  ORF type:complete len:113 (-),score=21.42 TRINITY_DN336_c0_g1_i4:461-799(-)
MKFAVCFLLFVCLLQVALGGSTTCGDCKSRRCKVFCLKKYQKLKVDIDKDVDIRYRIDKKLKADTTDVKGNSAFSEGMADARGNNTLTEVVLYTETDENQSSSLGEAHSGTA